MAETESKQLEDTITKALEANGLTRPAKQATETPNSASESSLQQIDRIAERADIQADDDLSFLVTLSKRLISERMLVENELGTWRKRCDDLMVDAIYRRLGPRPTFRG